MKNGSALRAVNENQQKQLEANGCKSSNWRRVFISEGQDLSRFFNVYFSGEVEVAPQQREMELPGGIVRPCGVFNSTIHNCKVGPDVFLDSVTGGICNYVIEGDVLILNTAELSVTAAANFGNGITVAVVNEAGGREIKLSDKLNAQAAYIYAMFRDRPKLVEKLDKMSNEYARSVCSSRGTIGRGTKIISCGIIRDVNIGPAAILEGVSKLINGSILSNSDSPVYLGDAVICKDFIIKDGASIDEAAIINKCFVGQGCRISKQFTAHESLFFANCDMQQGEACSVFAGPFTVSHHKSSLLLAGMYSFFNAGSASNISNHMYRLGPVHQAVFERGCKTGSGSYLVLPARIGPFSVVSGKHYRNLDTHGLPFSYIVNDSFGTQIIPAAVLSSIGMLRDSVKWPMRDNRKASKEDIVIFNPVNPYTGTLMRQAVNILEKLLSNSEDENDSYQWNNCTLKSNACRRGIRLYNAALNEYAGKVIANALQINGNLDLNKCTSSSVNIDQWCDLAGLLTPQAKLDELIELVEKGQLSDFDTLLRYLNDMYESCSGFELAWAFREMAITTGKDVKGITGADIAQYLTNAARSAEFLHELRIKNAQKEYDEYSRIGYGLSDRPNAAGDDFRAVRGELSTDESIAEMVNIHCSEVKILKNTAEKLQK